MRLELSYRCCMGEPFFAEDEGGRWILYQGRDGCWTTGLCVSYAQAARMLEFLRRVHDWAWKVARDIEQWEGVDVRSTGAPESLSLSPEESWVGPLVAQVVPPPSDGLENVPPSAVVEIREDMAGGRSVRFDANESRHLADIMDIAICEDAREKLSTTSFLAGRDTGRRLPN